MADKVKVPFPDGEVRITYGDSGETRTWRVQDGLVSPANLAERDALLRNVSGAKPAPAESTTPTGAKPAPAPKEK